MWSFFKRKKLERYINGCAHFLEESSKRSREKWKIGQEIFVSADSLNGIVQMEFLDGSKLFANYQVLGTFNTNDSTFMWGWNHLTVPSPLQVNALAVRDFAIRKEFDELTWHKV